jgi:hypothetical protein
LNYISKLLISVNPSKQWQAVPEERKLWIVLPMIYIDEGIFFQTLQFGEPKCPSNFGGLRQQNAPPSEALMCSCLGTTAVVQRQVSFV